MTNEEITRELKNVEKEYENKPTPTFSINISSMARSCRQHIEQLAKEKEELKAQIEKMKCCGNCKHAVCSDGLVIDCYKEPRCVNGDKRMINR